VPQDEPPALLRDRTCAGVAQLGEQIGFEAVEPEGEVLELLRVDQAADAVLGGAKRSRMTLKTRSRPGKVKTIITMPGRPGAMRKRSGDSAKCSMRFRYSSLLPCR
jgi:hypothetical protein